MNNAGDLLTVARVTLSLLVVLGVVLLAARLAKRAQVRAGGRGLRVLHRTALSREASVAVVAVGERGLLVGVTAHQVSLLAELDAAELGALSEPAPGAAVNVSAVLGDGPTDGPGDGRSGAAGPGVARRGSGSVLAPSTWSQALEALRDRTARRG